MKKNFTFSFLEAASEVRACKDVTFHHFVHIRLVLKLQIGCLFEICSLKT